MEENELINSILNKESNTASKTQDLIDKFKSNPVAFYLNVYENMNPDEISKTINTLFNKSCQNCTNSSCSIENDEKKGFDENGNYKGANCLGWENPELIGKSKILKINDINKMR